MAKTRKRQTARLTVERLEGREVPAASPWMLETFEQAAAGALPPGWRQHGSDDAAVFSTTPAQALGSDTGLRTDGSSTSETRTWSSVLIPADAQVSANVYLDSLVPAQVIARGQNLDTSTPSYYSAAVTRGLQIQLLRVTNGQSSVLATLQSSAWLSNQWVRVSLTTVGHDLYVQVFRTDTAQYLNANGLWQYTAVQAIHIQDGALTGPGNAGLARSAQYAGTVHFDNFMTSPPPADLTPTTLAQETFSRPVPGGLPAGWAQWSANGSSLRVSTLASITDSAGLRSIDAGPGEVRAWLDSDLPADADVSAAIFLDGLAPAEVIARGRNLGSNTPTYYAAAVTRGLGLQLLSVVDGQTTVLASLNSNQWVSGQWVRVTLSANGDDLRASVYRTDTGQYLDANGDWQVAPAVALEVHDSSIQTGGRAGLGRGPGVAGTVTFDSFGVSQSASQVAASSGNQDFDAATAGTAPPGWTQWSSNQTPAFQVTDQQALSGPNALMSNGGSDLESRTWLNSAYGPDAQVGASIYLDSLVPAQVIVRGQGLDGPAPTYYAASVTRGLDVQLLAVKNGQTTVLSTLSSNTWDSNVWVRVNLTAQGNTLQAQVVRMDSGQYLNQDGNWQADPAIALSVSDSSITAGGAVGLVRPASYSGRLLYDDFAAQAVATPTPVDPPPTTTPPDGSGPAGPPVTTPPTTTPPDDSGTPPTHSPPPTDGGQTTPGGTTTPPTGGGTTPPGTGGGTTTPPSGTTDPPPVSAPPSNLPPVPRHYRHIRIAEFAYSGTPIGAFEQGLLQNSVDVVIPNTDYLGQISAASSQTPQFIYTNASNVYRELLTDWLNYADAHGYDRESAFFHVTQAQAFTGASASSWPVVWFWNVSSGSDGSLKDVTSQARSGTDQLTFGAAGESVMIGNTEKFREINFNLNQGAAGGWSGALEYATAVDAGGHATAWKALNTLADGTNGFARSGRVTFDPPADWVPAAVGAGPQLYYVRVRTTADGTAPVAQQILGRDYVNANGGDHGTIPAFDRSADANGDGYLSDAEYANRKPGMDARFLYESRAFYPAYGQNRFATNVANAKFQEWTADYSFRFLQAHPQASGLFMDNSLSKIAFDPGTIAESLDHYADNYAELLAGINRKIAPHWVLANVAGGGTAVDALAKRGISYLEEFAIRPMAASYSQFEDVASNLKRRLDLGGGKSYAILDSLATNGSMNDPRVQTGTLAYYYLLADADRTLLAFNGGNDPNSSWTQHWTDAAKFDVGRAVGTWSQFAAGADPADTEKTYKVYQREYEHALVLYKPLSYFRGKAGSTADNTATTHQLGAKYRPLNADGTLGAPITRITLRNGEGAILVKV